MEYLFERTIKWSWDFDLEFQDFESVGIRDYEFRDLRRHPNLIHDYTEECQIGMP